jgi:hypothetical protein
MITFLQDNMIDPPKKSNPKTKKTNPKTWFVFKGLSCQKMYTKICWKVNLNSRAFKLY